MMLDVALSSQFLVTSVMNMTSKTLINYCALVSMGMGELRV